MTMIRLSKISIKNLKNVQSGNINFIDSVERSKNKSFADYRHAIETVAIKGIYGQNGSGKTACIDALHILKYLLCGMSLPNEIADFIHVGCDTAQITYEFKVILDAHVVDVYYTVGIKKVENIIGNRVVSHSGFKTIVDSELLSTRIHSERSIKKRTDIITVDDSNVTIPSTKLNDLFGSSNNVTTTELDIDRKIARASSRSFIFSNELLTRILFDNNNVSIYRDIIDGLVNYGNKYLFIVPVSHTGLINLNTLFPLEIAIEDEHGGTSGTIPIHLDKPNVLPIAWIQDIKQVIANMNIVLNQLIPGLTIAIRELGTEITGEGNDGQRIEFLSEKNEQAIPFKYESDGIKKIVSILSLLISIYNKHNVTVVIDELDAGIFEYLFGELLYIMQEGGRGQLIFTSHNLRPLEVLHKNNIAFTTSNPKNRYINMIGVKSTNNLRDFYLREILVDSQKEPLYQDTSNTKISFAFRKAGQINGTTW